MTVRTEDIFVGLVALALLPMIGRRLLRGLRDVEAELFAVTLAGAAKTFGRSMTASRSETARR